MVRCLDRTLGNKWKYRAQLRSKDRWEAAISLLMACSLTGSTYTHSITQTVINAGPVISTKLQSHRELQGTKILPNSSTNGSYGASSSMLLHASWQCSNSSMLSLKQTASNNWALASRAHGAAEDSHGSSLAWSGDGGRREWFALEFTLSTTTAFKEVMIPIFGNLVRSFTGTALPPWSSLDFSCVASAVLSASEPWHREELKKSSYN